MKRRSNRLVFKGIISGAENIFFLLIVLICLSGCNATKYLDEGQSFYDGAEIRFNTVGRVGGKKALENSLQPFLLPKPNAKIFGSRPQVWFYYKAGTPEKKKGFRNFVKNKLGKPPVLLSDVSPDRVAKLLAGQIYNDGYFQSTVTPQVVTKRKVSKVYYDVLLYPPYRLRNITYPKPRDSVYARILRTLYDESLLETKQRYDLERLQAEQARIEAEVENFGLYYFDDRYLIFEADSTVGEKQVDLDLKLEENIPERARKIHRINEVTVFPNYTLSVDTTNTPGDTIIVDRFNYVKQTDNFRPRVITRIINLTKGDIYSREAQDLTLSHLMDLGTFKFVNIKFTDVNEDSALLNTNIFLTPLKKKSLRAEVQAVSKSNNFVGPGVSLSFTNRNLLRGAELFEVTVNSSYEAQISRKTTGPLNAFELGINTSLTVPRFISPIKIDYSSKSFLPKTTVQAAFNLQNRINFFRLNSFNVSFGYLWRESASKSHQLFPIDLNFVKTDKRSPAFDSLLRDNRLLASSFENQFIVGSRYSYTLNTQMDVAPLGQFEERKWKTHSFYFNGNIDVAGNLLQTVQKQAIESPQGPFTLLGSPYSQFVRGDIDFRYYWQFDEHNKLVARIANGAGYAYGNSTTLPYVRQYSIGGSNSIRAFPARSIGPGTYDVRNDPKRTEEGASFFIDQRGDIKLEGNLEYRFDIYKAVKGAMFVDAGNIWTWAYDSTRVGSQFNKDDFYKQIVVGTGFGVRFDFNFFILRFDLAFPLRTSREKWVFDRIDILNSDWRSENLILNIAIGYPF